MKTEKARAIVAALEAAPADADRVAVVIAAVDEFKRRQEVLKDIHWFDLGDLGSWATDGHCAIRQGYPIPTRRGWHQWNFHLEPQALAELLKGAVAAAEPCPDNLLMHARFRPLWDGADVVMGGNAGRAVVIWRDGVLTACAMPCNAPEAAYPTIRLDGTVVVPDAR